MKIGIASDHRGYNLKMQLIQKLKEKYEIIDYGTNTTESTDYPDYAYALSKDIINEKINFGIAICGTGIGISIACNKVNGIRCAKVSTKEEAIATRNDNDSNIIAFGEKMTLENAIELIETFINTPCSMEEKHVRRRNKLKKIEEEN